MVVALVVGRRGGRSATYGLVPFATLCPDETMFDHLAGINNKYSDSL
jgi:hypothetical protein